MLLPQPDPIQTLRIIAKLLNCCIIVIQAVVSDGCFLTVNILFVLIAVRAAICQKGSCT